MEINHILGDVSIHNSRIRSNGTGSRRETFAVTYRFRNPLGIYQVQGQFDNKHRLYTNTAMFIKTVRFLIINRILFTSAFHVKHARPTLDICRRSEPSRRKVRPILLGPIVLRHFALYQSQQGPRIIRHRRTVTAILNCSNTILRQEKRLVTV